MLDRLKALSSLTANEFMAGRSAALKSHPIDWRHTSEPEGFTHLNEQFQSYTPYQFAVSRNEHGRVHGFLSVTCSMLYGWIRITGFTLVNNFHAGGVIIHQLDHG